MKKRKSEIHLKLGAVCVSNKADAEIRRLPHSPNRLIGKHWGYISAWKKAWETEVAERWLEEKQKTKIDLKGFKTRDGKMDLFDTYMKLLPYHRAKVKVFIFTIKPQDFDNAWASLKGVIDGLVKCGIIRNDDPGSIKTDLIVIPIKEKIAEHVELNITMTL